jgi:hypothetical protein
VLVTSRVDPSRQRASAVSWLVSPIELRDLRPSTISVDGPELPEGVAVSAEGWARSLEPPHPALVTVTMTTQIRGNFTWTFVLLIAATQWTGMTRFPSTIDGKSFTSS